MPVLVECIPNVSEGRSSRLVDSLGETLHRPPATALLHVHPDVDHNRTVYTVVGEPAALLTALEDLYEQVVRKIDLREHRGVHPRVGAVDVCPFVPLPTYGSRIETCVELARRLGERVGAKLDLPVFLYRAAATRPDRADLALIRKGQFEGLTDKLAQPEWRPDCGPARPHPTAGVTVIGARGPLIAYNVVLDCDDVAEAKAIAALVRASSGGLPGVKAMGVALRSRGLVQVSMNVEKPDTTPLHVAVEEVRRCAAVRGIDVLETELVGLMPLAAAAGAAAASLQLGEFGPERILEEAIARGLDPAVC